MVVHPNRMPGEALASPSSNLPGGALSLLTDGSFRVNLCFGQKDEEKMSQGPFLSKPLLESVHGWLPAFLRWADWQKCLWLLCSWAATNNSGFYPSAVCNSSTLAVFEALNSCHLSLQYVVLFGGDLSAHLTASVSPLHDLCLVNRNRERLIRVGQPTHDLEAVVTQKDKSSLLSSLCWGKVSCL